MTDCDHLVNILSETDTCLQHGSILFFVGGGGGSEFYN